jgi:Zn-dependent protease with chaperone function
MSEHATQFPATASHPDLGEGLVAGHLVVDRARIGFQSEHHTFDAPFLGLTMDGTGEPGEEIIFGHANWDEWRIAVRAPGPMSLPAFREHPTIQVLSQAARRSAMSRSNPKVLAKFLVVFTAVILGVYFGAGLVHRLLIASLPVTVDRNLGARAMEELQEVFDVVEAPELQRRCETYVKRLTTGFAKSGYQFRVLVVESEAPNAFALPGGTILVTTGITNLIDRSEELAGVLAHEIGHVVRRHSVQAQYGSVGLLKLLANTSGENAGASTGLAAGSLVLLNQSHSRDHEREADRFAVELLVQAGIDPHGLHGFLKNLMSVEGPGGGSRLGRALSSHPATAERLRYLDALAREQAAGKKFAPLD